MPRPSRINVILLLLAEKNMLGIDRPLILCDECAAPMEWTCWIEVTEGNPTLFLVIGAGTKNFSTQPKTRGGGATCIHHSTLQDLDTWPFRQTRPPHPEGTCLPGRGPKSDLWPSAQVLLESETHALRGLTDSGGVWKPAKKKMRKNCRKSRGECGYRPPLPGQHRPAWGESAHHGETLATPEVVDVLHGTDDLLEEAPHRLLAERPMVDNVLEELSALRAEARGHMWLTFCRPFNDPPQRVNSSH